MTREAMEEFNFSTENKKKRIIYKKSISIEK